MRHSASGTETGAALTLTDGRASPAAPLAPGAAARFTLAGWAPSRAGAYESAARFTGNAGAALAVPVRVVVTAAHLWGIACLLLGLMLVGALNLLSGEGAVTGALQDALRQRDAIHAFLDAHPPPRSMADSAAAMDEAFDAAVAALAARRPASVVDRRAAEGAEALKRAAGLADSLRTALARLPPGGAQVADLAQGIAAMKAAHEQVRAAIGTAPPPRADGLVGGLDALLAQARTRLLLAPMAWTESEAATALARAQLAAASDTEGARRTATGAQLWLDRSARTLGTALATYRVMLAEAGALTATDAALRARMASGTVPAPDAEAIRAHLDEAAAALAGDATIERFRAAGRAIGAARTAFVAAMAAQVQADLRAGLEQVEAATDTADVDALVAELQAAPDHSDAAKRAGLARVLDLWRGHVAGVSDAPTRAALSARLDALATIAQTGELATLAAPFRAFVEAWTDWHERQVQQAAARAEHPLCLALFADLERDRARMEAMLREHPEAAAAAGWTSRLDQLRLDMQRLGPDTETPSPGCVERLLTLDAAASSLSGAILAAAIADGPMPDEMRRRMMLEGGFTPLAELRLLNLRPVTPEADRIVGRPIAFALEGLDPAWAANVPITLDYGDGSAPVQTDAEAIRRGAPLAHSFAAPITAHAEVRARDAAARPLGAGTATVLVRPSPITAAQRLADDFASGRFGLALLIAGAIYYWRFAAKSETFGARSFDYVEAFALGFAANAAVAELPSFIVKLAGA